jgi:hypothetical protein
VSRRGIGNYNVSVAEQFIRSPIVIDNFSCPTTTNQQQAQTSSNSSNKATTTTPAKRGYKSHVPSACNVTIIIALTLLYLIINIILCRHKL